MRGDQVLRCGDDRAASVCAGQWELGDQPGSCCDVVGAVAPLLSCAACTVTFCLMLIAASTLYASRAAWVAAVSEWRCRHGLRSSERLACLDASSIVLGLSDWCDAAQVVEREPLGDRTDELLVGDSMSESRPACPVRQ